MKESLLNAEKVRDVLSYDPDTGLFAWKKTGNRALKIGDRAGYLHPRGYVYIKIGNHSYAAHRLAWLIVHGQWPQDQLDHRNGVRSDNRISNLRPCVGSTENNQNTAKYGSNRTGFHGVGWHKASGRWRARINAGGRQYHLGAFDTPEEASAAYLAAKARLHDYQPVPRNA
jgi:hypothetical protein